MTRLLQVFTGVLASVQSLAAAFDRPTLGEIEQARGALHGDGLAQRVLYAIDSDFQPIPYPGPRDWLSQHSETGQTFADFVRSGAQRPDDKRRFIYLQPLGEFAGAEGAASLAELQSYTAAFFHSEQRH